MIREPTKRRCVDCGIPVSRYASRCKGCAHSNASEQAGYIPDPTDIEAAAAEIRKSWTYRDRIKAAGANGPGRISLPVFVPVRVPRKRIERA